MDRLFMRTKLTPIFWGEGLGVRGNRQITKLAAIEFAI